MHGLKEAYKVTFPLRVRSQEYSKDIPGLKPLATAADMICNGLSALVGGSTSLVLTETLPQLPEIGTVIGGVIIGGIFKACINSIIKAFDTN